MRSAPKQRPALYVYSRNTLKRNNLEPDEAFFPVDHRICFAGKSNWNQAVKKAAPPARVLADRYGIEFFSIGGAWDFNGLTRQFFDSA